MLMAVSCGVEPVGPPLATFNESALEAVPPVPFCTVREKLPDPDRRAEPVSCVEEPVTPVAEHGMAQPGPEKYTSAEEGSKLAPVTVKLKDWPATGALGTVEMTDSCGIAAAAPATVRDRLFDAPPALLFHTVTLKEPAERVALPLT